MLLALHSTNIINEVNNCSELRKIHQSANDQFKKEILNLSRSISNEINLLAPGFSVILGLSRKNSYDKAHDY